MNTAACQQVIDGVGMGVAASLRAVDCVAGATAQAAFGRLFGSEGALAPALTILLTIYVALFAFALITGRTRVGIAALTPRMVTLGLVLTFATSWLAYQGVVWNLAVGAPDQLAAILTGTSGSATQVFADKIDVVFSVLVDASGAQTQEGQASTFSPPGLLWLGATLLLLGTVGILATTKIALAILMALGPVFVVLALFPSTRGLFTGWLKGLVMLALTPVFAVLGGSLMLELSVPVLQTLTATPGQIDGRAAMAFFLIGAVHAALMVMVLKVAGTMVAGWTVFGFANAADNGEGRTAGSAPRPAHASLPPAAPQAEPARATSPAVSRGIRLASPALAPANDVGSSGGSIRRETRVLDGSAAAAAGSAGIPLSRARGIGSRFRAAPARPRRS
jgi:type IV secretion system protein VirB6